MSGDAAPKKWRLRLMALVLIALGGVLVVRLAQIQIVDHDRYVEAARENHLSERTVQGPRGAILDRNGLPLVTGIETFDIHIDRHVWELDSSHERLAVERLAELLGVGPEQVRTIAGAGPERDALLATHVPYVLGEAIIAQGLPGVKITPSGVRRYSEGGLASQLLGFVGRDGQGLAGVEFEFESLLRGDPGSVVVERDSTGNPIPFGQRTIEPPAPGADIVLTIDRNLQRLAEAELARALADTGARGGSILMMDPHTGDILAVASAPSFNVSTLSLNDPDLDLSLFRNRIATDVYEPGSVFKVITMAGAIDAAVVTPTSTFNDTGAVAIGTRTIRNFDLSFHGRQTMTQVLQRSLNTGSTWVAQRMGPSLFYDYVHRFGFGEATGSGFSGEATGLLKEPGNLFWSDVDLATNSYGQGISVTPLQIVRAYSAIANGGHLVQPRIVRALITNDGVREFAPVLGPRAISEESARTMRFMMQAVVDGVLGHPAQAPGWPIAGKSGTSDVVEGGRYIEGESIASFAGFAPADDPRVVVLVKLDRPQGEIFGGVVAAPVFARLMTGTLSYLGVPPSSYVAEPTIFDPPAGIETGVLDADTTPFDDGSADGSASDDDADTGESDAAESEGEQTGADESGDAAADGAADAIGEPETPDASADLPPSEGGAEEQPEAGAASEPPPPDLPPPDPPPPDAVGPPADAGDPPLETAPPTKPVPPDGAPEP